MSELRLAPAALLAWAVALAILTATWWPALLITALTAGAAWYLRAPGQAILVAAAGAAQTVVTAVSAARAAVRPPAEVTGTLAAPARQIDAGLWLLRIRVPDRPAPLPVFLRDEELSHLPAGTPVTADVRWRADESPGLAGYTGTAGSLETGEPTGHAGWVAGVRAALRAASEAHVGESSRGLVPGMVLGDTSLMTPAEEQAYIDTGLTHLTAVSGANVTVVTAAAFIVVRLVGLGPRVQVGAAFAALVVFVALVGTEPSVLRAAVTGSVGLLAVIGSARLEPAHGLCLAVLVLLLVDPGLAAQWGFALSVAATAGIVAVFPALYRALARPWLPDALTRAACVALAADVVTMPLIAGMAGRVSLVSVAANVLVGPAVAPVTVLGLIAAGLAVLPGGLEAVPLVLLEPCTWWIHRVAVALAELPLATVAAGPLWVVVCYGWVVFVLLTRRRGGGVARWWPWTSRCT